MKYFCISGFCALLFIVAAETPKRQGPRLYEMAAKCADVQAKLEEFVKSGKSVNEDEINQSL